LFGIFALFNKGNLLAYHKLLSTHAQLAEGLRALFPRKFRRKVRSTAFTSLQKLPKGKT